MKFTFPPESKPLDGFTIKRAIQRGGFGEVYYALSDAGKEVALKLLQQNMDVELRGVSQCLNLKHPNLVTIFDIRTDGDGDHWIVMEYVSGKCLDQTVTAQAGPLPIDEVTSWMEGICAGLGFLHDRGIVHRDLKPANIYRENGVVKIGDVGLAKFISESRRSAQTQSVGTVYYMAPEVARGRYGREVDIYSLGIILYELLTGDVPFDGESTAEILMKHLSEKPDLTPIPPKLRPVLAKVLEKDPMRRTPSAMELLNDYRRALAGAELAAEIPEDSFRNETLTDTSVANRAEADAPSDDDFRLQSGIPLESHAPDNFHNAARRAHKEVRRAAHHARIEARKAAQIARREARKAIRYAREQKKHWDRRPVAKRPYAAGTANRGRPNGNQSTPASTQTQIEHRNQTIGFWIRILVVVVVILALTAPRALGNLFEGLFIVGLYAGIGYGVYRFLMYFVGSTGGSAAIPQGTLGPHENVHGGKSATPVAEQPPVSPVRAAPPVMQAVHVKKVKPIRAGSILTPKARRLISPRARLTDLTGSMTVAAFCTLILTVILGSGTPILETPAQMGLFGITTLLAVWALLIPSKISEGRGVESGTMRLMQLGAGVLIGLGAFWISETLMVKIPTHGLMDDAIFTQVGSYHLAARNAGWQPTMVAYLVFFGALFSFRRWWWQSDSFRKKRFRAISTLLTVCLALMLTYVWAFPKVWAITWAASISAILQLSSGWTAPEHRLEPVSEEASDE